MYNHAIYILNICLLLPLNSANQGIVVIDTNFNGQNDLQNLLDNVLDIDASRVISDQRLRTYTDNQDPYSYTNKDTGDTSGNYHLNNILRYPYKCRLPRQRCTNACRAVVKKICHDNYRCQNLEKLIGDLGCVRFCLEKF